MNDRTPTEAKLLPCPFCGSVDPRHFNNPDEFGRPSHGLQCTGGNCAITGPETETPEEAIAAWNRRASPPAPAAEPVADLEEAIRLAEIGEFLYSHAYSYGDGYTEPREYGIEWQWQQTEPNTWGQGALLAASTRWHNEQAADGTVTEAAKLRSYLTHPIDAAAIRAEARREALEEAAAWHDDQAALHDAQGEACGTGSDGWTRHTVAAADHRRSATSIRALADKGEAEGWRPIETAPHDGTHVQVCDVRQPSMPPFTAHWFGPPPLPGLRSGNWYLSVNRNGDDADHGCRSLTHWRPLPAPPAGGRDDGA